MRGNAHRPESGDCALPEAMRRASTPAAAVLGVLLLGSPAVVAQQSARREIPASVFSRAAIFRAVSQQAAVVTPSSAKHDWPRVAALDIGSDVHVLVRGRGMLARRMIRADADHLALLNVQSLEPNMRDACLRLLRENHGLFDAVATGRSFVSRGVRVGPDGIRDETNVVRASIADVLEHVARQDVLEVSTLAESPRRTLGRLGLVLIVTSTVVNVIDSRRRCDCGEMGVTPAGAALMAGGVVAMAASARYPRVERGTRSVVFKTN